MIALNSVTMQMTTALAAKSSPNMARESKRQTTGKEEREQRQAAGKSGRGGFLKKEKKNKKAASYASLTTRDRLCEKDVRRGAKTVTQAMMKYTTR